VGQLFTVVVKHTVRLVSRVCDDPVEP